MHPDSVRVRVRSTLVFIAALIGALLVSPILAAQAIDVVDPHVRATTAFTPRGEAAPLPVSSFSVSHGIGIVTDDGSSYWPGYPSDLQAPATFHVTPTASNTFIVQRVAFQFDDPSTGVIAYDGAKRPIVGFLDANYLPPAYTLPAPFTFAGKQYTKLSISTWGAVAFGDADTTQVNYDPTVVSSMFHIQPIIAVWYELFNYTNTSRIITKNKPNSVVITWQNVLSRHSTTPCTFQVELFTTGEMNLSYQTLPIGDGLIGFSTGTETPTRQNAIPVIAAGLPSHLQVASASFDNYGGIIAGVTIKAGATIPTPASGESFRYTLMLNGIEAGAVEVGSNLSTSFIVSTPKIPEFPGAQINKWEVKLNGDTLSFRVPASSLEPYLNRFGSNTWAIKSNRFGGAGFLEGTVTQTLPLTFSSMHSLLPSPSGGAPIEVPAEVFHYMPGVWDTDRIRESIAAYLVSRGQNVDSFRFFPTTYDDGLKHSNYAGTYPRQKNVTGAGVIPARTECDCHYGAEFSALGESLASEGTTQVALTHELGHECVFYADYKDVDGTVKGPWRDAGVPCFGGAHPNNGLANPSMFADTESGLTTISVMGGSVAGTYSLTSPRFGYSRVEMYFLGLASPAEVTPITFVRSDSTSKITTSQITIDQIIAANGPRTPAYVSGQTRLYRVPTFVVQRNGEGNIDAQVQQLQNVLWRWQSRFWRETGGRARANLTLDGSCSFTFSATSVMPAATSSTGTINVMSDAGCGWTSSSSDSWLTIISGGSGTGDGKLNYSIAANASANARTGTITIAGQPFTVTQLGTARRRSVGR